MGNVELSHAPGAIISADWVEAPGSVSTLLSTLSAGSTATAATVRRSLTITLRSIAGVLLRASAAALASQRWRSRRAYSLALLWPLLEIRVPAPRAAG